MVNASAADASFAIKKTLIQLDIPITVDDPKLHAIGNSDFNKVYRIGGRPMTEYVDCGSTPNGARASTYRVYMSFITTVEPTAPQVTKMKSVLVANAREVSGSSSNRVPCGSTGKLERMLIDSVRVIAGR